MIARTVLLLLPAASAFGFATLDGDRSKWNRNPSFSFGRLLPAIQDGSVQQALRDAFAAWAQVPGSNLRFQEVAQRGDFTLEFLADWPAELGDTTAGVTFTNRRGGVISSAEIQFNAQNFEWSTRGEVGKADVAGIAAHEIGHGIGLGHSFYRSATMYWTGDDGGLAELDPDDIRGMRFLYGNGGEGVMCDTCLDNNDCAAGGICLGLEPDRAFCGQPCNGPQDCPDHAACFELQGGGTSCAPVALVCSDRADGEFAEGDYCFGASQCSGDQQCIPTPGGAACTAPGSVAFGGECASNFECRSQLCLPLDDTFALCSQGCNPARPNCPAGAECLAIEDPQLDGLCLPGGSAGDGEPCDNVRVRCRVGLVCLGDTDRCTPACDPNANDCADGRACLELVDGSGACAPGAGRLGDPCESGLDCGSTVCVDVDGAGQCSRGCPSDTPCPAGWDCRFTNQGPLCFPEMGAGGEGGMGGMGGAGGEAGAGGQAGAGGAGGEVIPDAGAGGSPADAGAGGAGGAAGAGGVGGGGGGAPPVDATVEPQVDSTVPPVVISRGGGGGEEGCASAPGRPVAWWPWLGLWALPLVRRRRHRVDHESEGARGVPAPGGDA